MALRFKKPEKRKNSHDQYGNYNDECLEYETTMEFIYNFLVVPCSEKQHSPISKKRLQDVLKEILQKLTPGQLADFLEKI